MNYYDKLGFELCKFVPACHPNAFRIPTSYEKLLLLYNNNQ